MQLTQRLAGIQGAPEYKVVLLRPTTQSGMPPYFIVGCFGGGVSTLYPLQRTGTKLPPQMRMPHGVV